MSSRTRSYIPDTPMWRGVNLRPRWTEEKGHEVLITYTGPYDTPGKAKASVYTEGGYIERAEPVWERVEEWTRTR